MPGLTQTCGVVLACTCWTAALEAALAAASAVDGTSVHEHSAAALHCAWHANTHAAEPANI